jgi:Flp pilus assembly CpaE family ATPase
MLGIVSAKGGCGATTIACHLAAALQRSQPKGRVLVVDLDYQSASAHRCWRVTPRLRVADAFHAARRLNSAMWQELVTTVSEGVDFLGGPGVGVVPPEPWRIDTLFRFAASNYAWVLIDLGRQLNPANWSFLDNVDQLYVVTAPDVLALYQTRSMLQTLTNRGFERSRLRLILNRNEVGPRDFWVESIRQMFEMGVTAAIPDDHATMGSLAADRYQFPEGTSFGKSVMKLAGQVVKQTMPVTAGAKVTQ